MKYEHVQYIDLYGNGIPLEVIVLKEELNGDKSVIQTTLLDEIDLDRIRAILARRDAALYPLWDLMSQTTLRNGMNALEYFHQLVKVKTAAGPIVQPGRAGQRVIRVNVPQSSQQGTADSGPRRGPGRPAKAPQ